MQRLARLHLKNLSLDALIGVHAHEKSYTQTIVIDLSISYDSTQAIETDNIASAVCYDAVYKSVITFVSAHRFQLLETLSAQLITHLHTQFSTLAGITVRIHKPQALQGAQVSVEMSSVAGAQASLASQ